MKDKAITCPECGCDISTDALSADAARRRYFAILRDAWSNLPAPWDSMFPSPEHLRKHMLCRVGWCDTSQVACGSKKAAIDVASAMKSLNGYAVIEIRGDVVTASVARSQSRKSQPKQQFMECADAIYQRLSELIGADITERAA